jgi:two-component system sensor histidine kinase/response regulator
MNAPSIAADYRSSQSFLSSVFDKIDTGILLSDLKGHVLDANPYFLNTLGFEREEIVGKMPTCFTPSHGIYTSRLGEVFEIGEDYFEETQTVLSALDKTGEIKDWTTFYVDKEGKLVPVQQHICLLKDSMGNSVASMCLVKDLSDKKNLEAELEKAKNLAETAKELKEFFLSKISNEIRVPMNGLCGFTELLIDNEQITEEYKEQLHVIRKSSEDLLSMINNIIDYAKIENGKIDIADIGFDIELLFYSIIIDTKAKLADKKIEFQHEITNQVPFLLKGDPSRIRQIVQKLLDNAIKHTRSGSIKVTLDVEPEHEHESDITVRFHVQDTGVGMPKGTLESIFALFYKGDGALTRKSKGLGIGLHVCRSIARLMRGDLYATSKLGKGSSFYFTVKLCRSEKIQTAKSAAPVNLQGKTVFILDFEKIHLDIVSKFCKQAQMKVLTCGNIQDVSPQFQDLIINKTQVDLFVMDVTSSFEDISEIVELIRENFGLHVPLLAFTSPNRGTAKACQNMGFNGCLSKPCSKLSFYEIIKHLFTEDFDATGGREILTRYSLSEKIKHNLNILVVDDNRINQLVAMKILTQSGYAVDCANDGMEATNKVLTAPHKYDVILMDIQMPIMNGVDATIMLRQNDITTPIIAYTAHALDQDFERYKKAGMDDCIPKPVNREIILEKFYKLCFRPESRLTK